MVYAHMLPPVAFDAYRTASSFRLFASINLLVSCAQSNTYTYYAKSNCPAFPAVPHHKALPLRKADSPPNTLPSSPRQLLEAYPVPHLASLIPQSSNLFFVGSGGVSVID